MTNRMIPFVVCGLTGLAAGGDVTLQNDSNAGFSPCLCYIPGEEAAAWLTSPCTGNITEVQIGWGSPFGGAPDQLEMEIRIYREADANIVTVSRRVKDTLFGNAAQVGRSAFSPRLLHPHWQFPPVAREGPDKFDTTPVRTIVSTYPRLGEGRWSTGAAGKAGS